MIIKKMAFHKINTQKWGNFKEELNDTQEWGEIIKIDPKLGRLSSPSPFLGAAEPGTWQAVLLGLVAVQT